MIVGERNSFAAANVPNARLNQATDHANRKLPLKIQAELELFL